MLRFKKLSLQLIAQFKDNLQLNEFILHHTIKKFIKPNDFNFGEKIAYKSFKNKIFNVSDTIIGRCAPTILCLIWTYLSCTWIYFGLEMHFFGHFELNLW